MARLIIDLEAIRHNARLVAGLCARHGVALTAVTKGVLGDSLVARAILDAGVTSLGDSRLQNIRRMREAGCRTEFHLLRTPSPGEVDAVLALADVSYHSEVEVVRAVAGAASERGMTHRVVLMVDVGDRREGVMPEDVPAAAEAILGLRGVSLHGLGTNVGCVSGVLPSPANLGLLADLAADIETRLGQRVALVSGGSSTSLPLMWEGRLPPRVNHLRLGTAILLGDYNTWAEPIPGARHDAFDLVAPVVEVKWKPSLPVGETGVDAFERTPVFEDRGPMLRAICALGRQEVYVEGLQPRQPGWRVVAASSDHLIMDATAAAEPPRLGEQAHFRLSYAAMLFAMQSPAVTKVYVDEPPSQVEGQGRPDKERKDRTKGES